MHRTAELIARSLTCLVLAFAVMPAAYADDWPGFQGADRDGVAQDATLLTDWPEAGPATRWTQNVGPGFGGAAIKDSKVYILDRNGMEGDALRVFDLQTGQQRWQTTYAAPGRSSYHGSRCTPTVTDTHAYTVGPFGHIVCFDLNTQQVAWQKHMDDFGAFPPKFAWSQSPLIVGDWIVVAPMAGEAGLVALDQKTGAVVWKSDDIGREGYSSPRLVTLAGQPQIVYLSSTQVTGTDPETGKVLWSYDGIPVRRGIPTPTPVGDDRLFITAGYDAGSALLQIRRNGDGFTASEIKRDNAFGGQIHSALLVNNHLFVNLNTNETLRRRNDPADGLGCFDTNGKLLWKSNNTPNIDRGPVLAVGSHLLTLGGEDGVLRLIHADPAGYKEHAAAKVFDVKEKRNMIWAAMAFADGYLIIRSQGQLKCIDLRAEQISQQD